MYYITTEDILKAEHKLLIDAVDNVGDSSFTSGYITGIVALAAELTEKEGN